MKVVSIMYNTYMLVNISKRINKVIDSFKLFSLVRCLLQIHNFTASLQNDKNLNDLVNKLSKY